jgi:hypothetical protein
MEKQRKIKIEINGQKYVLRICVVAHLLKTRIVEPEKQPLLAKGPEATFVSRQRPRNKERNNVHCQATPETYTQTTTEELCFRLVGAKLL